MFLPSGPKHDELWYFSCDIAKSLPNSDILYWYLDASYRVCNFTRRSNIAAEYSAFNKLSQNWMFVMLFEGMLKFLRPICAFELRNILTLVHLPEWSQVPEKILTPIWNVMACKSGSCSLFVGCQRFVKSNACFGRSIRENFLSFRMQQQD